MAVTGASGHIGNVLVSRLVSLGFRVRVLIHKSTDNLGLSKLEVVNGSVNNPEDLERLVNGCRAVFHLAGLITIDNRHREETDMVNIAGTENMLKACRTAGQVRLIHFSSIHALQPSSTGEELNEDSPLALESRLSYERSKAVADLQVRQSIDRGQDAVILYPTAVIGPGDFKPSLFGRAIQGIAQKRLPAIVPGGYNFVDVRDVVEASVVAMETARPGRRYILSGHFATLQEVAELISEITGKGVTRTVLPWWMAYAGVPFIRLAADIAGRQPLYTRQSLDILRKGSLKISNSLAASELGYSPRPLKETLKDLLDFFAQHSKTK
ncbi:MAG: NAD-dependent epimerase/dehydratase family protein [Bacteroidales bacterium]